MKFVGIDLHKKSISLCVRDASGRIVTRKRFSTGDTEKIVAFFKSLAVFRFCVEATSAYEWLVQLLEPMAQGWVLVHPGRMRLIAESTDKSDKVDAEVLSEFLWLGKLPRAYRPLLSRRLDGPIRVVRASERRSTSRASGLPSSTKTGAGA